MRGAGWLLLFLAACSAPKPDPPGPPPWSVRDCLTRFVFDDGASHRAVVVSGAFSGWSETANRLERQDDGSWALELPLDVGLHAYKFVVDGEWGFDPANPFRIWEGGTENSRVRVTDCDQPQLEVSRFEVGADGSLLLEAVFIAGGDGAAPVRVRMELDSVGVTQPGFDPQTGQLVFRVEGLAAGRHDLSLLAEDENDRGTDRLRLPFWVETTPFEWEGAIVYFAFTDRFQNGDATNDPPASGVEFPARYQGGDFRGITLALGQGYFDALGVEVLWLSPFQDNPEGGFPGSDGRDYTGYHGYWPSNARDTEASFGSLEELRALVDAAHARGIRVLGDLVLNHVHDEHPYAAQRGWTNGDGSCVCGTPGCGWSERALDCWFTSYLPDVNWRNPGAAAAMVDDALWWFHEARLDGFRVDAVKHFESVALRNLRGELDRIEALTGVHAHLVGETFTGDGERPLVASYIGSRLLDGQFDFPLYWTVVRTFARGEATFVELDAAVIAGEAAWPTGALMSPFLGNHDVPRFHSHAAGDIADVWGNGSRDQGWNAPPTSLDQDEPYARQALAFAFLLTQPGLPLLYYGDEIGLAGAGDPDNRRMMRFGTDLSAREQGLFDQVALLALLRKNTPALRTGTRRTLHVEDDLYVYVRDAGADQYVVVALNRSPTLAVLEVTLDGALAGVARFTFQERIGGGNAVAIAGKLIVRVPAMGTAIYTP